MNKIQRLFQEKQENILSVYFIAGYPKLDDTKAIIKQLEKKGANMLEVGIPFSDPMADGSLIRSCSKKALENGMSLKTLLKQLEEIKDYVSIPIILTGYLNPIMKYGMKKFCEDCKKVGVAGTIIPDLPLNEYIASYKDMYKENNLSNIFLITAQTSDERIRLIDDQSNGFVYVVSASPKSKSKGDIFEEQKVYFKKLQEMNLKNPCMIGLGATNKTFANACKYANGATIGGALMEKLSKADEVENAVNNFMMSVNK